MAGIDQGIEGIPLVLDLPGVRLAVLDTVIPGSDSGRITADQLEWLDDARRGRRARRRPAARLRPPPLLGPRRERAPRRLLRHQPRRLRGVARRSSPAGAPIKGWFAGHTHRNRVRRFPNLTGDVPFVEVACVKDYPGSWAEYRVYEGGILQVHRRLSSPAALAWSESCRALYGGAYPAYALGALDDRCFALAA